jgi:porphobilinogen deaminase
MLSKHGTLTARYRLLLVEQCRVTQLCTAERSFFQYNVGGCALTVGQAAAAASASYSAVLSAEVSDALAAGACFMHQ